MTDDRDALADALIETVKALAKAWDEGRSASFTTEVHYSRTNPFSEFPGGQTVIKPIQPVNPYAPVSKPLPTSNGGTDVPQKGN